MGRPDIREEADADLGHREEVAVARNAVAAMQGDADAAAHDDAVDQRDIGLRIALDAGVEDVFLAPEGEHFVMAARPPS